MKMMEKICLTGFLLGTIMGAILPTRIKACFNARETSQFTFNQKVYGYTFNWEGYNHRDLGFSGSTVNPFSEAL
jgi:hypothetical protein